VLSDQDVTRLERIARTFRTRLRTHDPAENHVWLAGQLNDAAELVAVCFVLAAVVPDDVPWARLLGWACPHPVDTVVDDGMSNSGNGPSLHVPAVVDDMTAERFGPAPLSDLPRRRT